MFETEDHQVISGLSTATDECQARTLSSTTSKQGVSGHKFLNPKILNLIPSADLESVSLFCSTLYIGEQLRYVYRQCDTSAEIRN